MFVEGKSLELLIAAIVALVVVGPKDLPVLLRRLGQFMAKLRGMAAEFRASFDEMARQSELDELRKEVEALRQGQLTDMAHSAAGGAEVDQAVEEIHRNLADVGVQLHPPMSYQYVENPADPPVVEPSPAAAAAAAPRARKPAGKAADTSKAKTAPKAASGTSAATPATTRRKSAAKPRSGARPAKRAGPKP